MSKHLEFSAWLNITLKKRLSISAHTLIWANDIDLSLANASLSHRAIIAKEMVALAKVRGW